MTARRTHRSALALVILSGLAQAALAQGTAPAPGTPAKATPKIEAPGKQPTKAPAKADQPQDLIDAQAQAVLDGARDAARTLKGLAYTATLQGPGSGSKGKSTLNVVIQKADSGDWMLAVKGTAQGEKGPSNVHVTFDGTTLMALRESDKVVLERKATGLSEAEAFFGRQGVKQAVAFSLLGKDPLALPAGAKVRHERTQKIEGVDCDVLLVETAEETQRWFFGREDKLPRQIFAMARGASGAGLNRTITFSEVKKDELFSADTFSVKLPAGFASQPEKSPVAQAPSAPGANTPAPGAGSDNPAFRVAQGLLPVGTAAPAWTLKDDAGNTVNLSDFKGKVVFMDFWGTWCPPCRAAMPKTQRLHERFKDQDVVVLGMNFERDPKANPRKFMDDNKYTFGLILKGETIASKYRVRGWPTFYVIDREGKVVFGEVGYDPSHEKDFIAAIEAALAKK
ncbi:MAG: TlpA disulfide reductase family protein [Planctomycetota bacterium]|nr:TlpA disulfide reductase family protein [Planctomycetota bacterium]